MTDLASLSSGEFETLLLSTRQRVRTLRRRLLLAARSGATTRNIARHLAAAEAELRPVEAEWWHRYTGGRE